MSGANTQNCILADKRKGGCSACPAQCPHYIALHGLNGEGGRIAAAGLPKEYRHVTLANSPVRESQAKVYTALERYAATFGVSNTDKSVYLWSESPGTGKTTTASALLNEWIARNYIGSLRKGEQPAQLLGIFFDVNEFQTEYNLATMTNEDASMAKIKTKILRVQRAPFAVIDDIGVRGATEAFRAYVHAVINYRVTNGLPTVYTSNLPIGEMAQVFDARLYDRIRDNCGVIHFEGVSKRGRR